MTPDAGGRSAAVRAWAELLRLPAAFTVPGDALAGAAAAGCRPNRGTLLAVGTSLCLYEAGMALNDWADRDEDARERPSRPLPSGRITPGAALTAAAALTGAGLGLAALAGRPAFATATVLAGTVWAYDLGTKHTRAASATMAAARALDLLLGAAATRTAAPEAARAGGREDLRAAVVLGAHTLAVTSVSRHETTGGSSRPPLAALAAVGGIAAATARRRHGPRPDLPAQVAAAAYAATAARPLLHAALNPSPPLLQRAVGGGIRAMVPLQAALAARAGAPGTALAVTALAPLARRFARKVSLT